MPTVKLRKVYEGEAKDELEFRTALNEAPLFLYQDGKLIIYAISQIPDEAEKREIEGMITKMIEVGTEKVSLNISPDEGE